MSRGEANVVSVRDATGADFGAILGLNQASVAETGPLDLEALARLSSMAACLTVAADAHVVAGFLVGLRERAAYENENFRWFRERFARFIYIDRIVVHHDRRGTGVGGALYAAVERLAGETGVDLLACEVNLVPENRASLAFHQRLGFVEVGRQALPLRAKIVAMLVRRLPPAPAQSAG